MKLSTKLIVIASVVIAGTLSTPYFVGHHFKSQYMTIVRQMNAANNKQIAMTDYHTGWLKSTVKLTIPMLKGDPASGMKQVDCIIRQTIYHGPLLRDPVTHHLTIAMANIHSIVHINEAEKFLAARGTQIANGLAQIQSLVNFNLLANNHIIAPAIVINLPGVGNFNWSGLSGDIAATSVHGGVIDKITSNIQFGTFNFQTDNPESPVQVVAITTPMQTADIKILPNQLVTGEYTFNVLGVTVQSNMINFTLDNLNSKHTISVTNKGLYSTQSTLSISKIDLPDFVVPAVNALRYDLSINNLNANQLAQLEPLLLQGKFNEALVHAITPATTVAVNASANTSFGLVQVDGKGYWPENLPVLSTLNDIDNNAAATITLKAAIPLVTALIDKYAEFTPYGQVDQTATVQNTAGSDKNVLNEAVAELLEKGQVELAMSLQIMQMGSQAKTEEEFASDIDSLKLPKEVANTLKEKFKLQLSLKPVQPTPTPVSNLTPSEKVKAKMAEWINAGLITQDNDHYSTTILREGGKTIVNGQAMQN